MKRSGPVGPVFRRVLACFESQAEFARQLGLADRRLVREWQAQMGYIPLRWAVQAAALTAGKVSPIEVINETNRMMDRRRIERETLRAVAAQSAEGVE